MPSAHPPHDMLVAYAAGVASEATALLVAAHATYCPVCRAEIARIEALDAALMASEPSGNGTGDPAPGPDALERLLARLDEAAPAAAGPAAGRRLPADALLPRPVLEAVGAPFRDIRWRFVMPGVSRCELDMAGDEQAMLLRVRPGAGVPAHTHTGREATLVLCGALRDRGQVFARGDVAVATAQDDHHPRAEPGADCVCLAVMDGGVRFTGGIARALNIFAE